MCVRIHVHMYKVQGFVYYGRSIYEIDWHQFFTGKKQTRVLFAIIWQNLIRTWNAISATLKNYDLLWTKY